MGDFDFQQVSSSKTWGAGVKLFCPCPLAQEVRDLRTEEDHELFIRPGTGFRVRGTDRSQIQEPSQGTEGDWASRGLTLCIPSSWDEGAGEGLLDF